MKIIQSLTLNLMKIKLPNYQSIYMSKRGDGWEG